MSKGPLLLLLLAACGGAPAFEDAGPHRSDPACAPCHRNVDCVSGSCFYSVTDNAYTCAEACSPDQACPAGLSCQIIVPFDRPRYACLSPSWTCRAAPAEAPDGGPWQAMPHPAPGVRFAGGAVLAHPELVTITHEGYPHRGDVEAFGDALVKSAWLPAVGAEYGIGSATHAQPVRLPTAAPETLTDADLRDELTALFDQGLLPRPVAPSQRIYMLYLPASTSVVREYGQRSCFDFGGYHGESSYLGTPFVYAVVNDCQYALFPTERLVDAVTSVASHEFIEASTDPLLTTQPAYEIPPDDGWGWIGGEVADLCATDALREDGWVYQRSWSNNAADAGLAPCVPASTVEPYHSVFAAAGTVLVIAPGTGEDLGVNGWSTGPIEPWQVHVVPIFSPDFDAHPVLSGDLIGNGQSLGLSVSVPAGTPSNRSATLGVYSLPTRGSTEVTVYPIVIITP